MVSVALSSGTCEAGIWGSDAKNAVPMHIFCCQIPYLLSGWWQSYLGHFNCLAQAREFCARTAVSKIPVVARGTAWAEDGARGSSQNLYLSSYGFTGYKPLERSERGYIPIKPKDSIKEQTNAKSSHSERQVRRTQHP